MVIEIRENFSAVSRQMSVLKKKLAELVSKLQITSHMMISYSEKIFYSKIAWESVILLILETIKHKFFSLSFFTSLFLMTFGRKSAQLEKSLVFTIFE